MSSVAVFGAGGGVGATVSRLLAAVPDVTRLWMFDINDRALAEESMDASAIAEKQRNESLRVETRVLDMRDEEAVAEAITTSQADILIQAAIPYSWYRIARTLPPDTWRQVFLEGRLGPWLPLFSVLPVKLMRGRKLAGVDTPVVQISFPDGVNPMLAGMGMAPTSGAGNTESVATVMRVVVAERLGVPVRDVTVRMVGHHFHSGFMRSDAPNSELETYPLWYRLYCAGEDVTARFQDDAFITELRQRFPFQRPLYAASSAVQNALRILRDDRTVSHVCSPGGLPGAFDARLGRDGAEVVWHSELPEPEAMELVRKCAEGDGIAGYDANGSVRFTERAHAALVKHLNYDCPVLKPDEVEERADELVARLNEAAR